MCLTAYGSVLIRQYWITAPCRHLSFYSLFFTFSLSFFLFTLSLVFFGRRAEGLNVMLCSRAVFLFVCWGVRERSAYDVFCAVCVCVCVCVCGCVCVCVCVCV